MLGRWCLPSPSVTVVKKGDNTSQNACKLQSTIQTIAKNGSSGFYSSLNPNAAKNFHLPYLI